VASTENVKTYASQQVAAHPIRDEVRTKASDQRLL